MARQNYKISTAKAIPADANFTRLRRKAKKITEVNDRETYPFSKLTNVGSSFTVPGKTARDLRGAIYGATERYNHKYISRTESNGARVWRVQ